MRAQPRSRSSPHSHVEKHAYPGIEATCADNSRWRKASGSGRKDSRRGRGLGENSLKCFGWGSFWLSMCARGTVPYGSAPIEGNRARKNKASLPRPVVHTYCCILPYCISSTTNRIGERYANRLFLEAAARPRISSRKYVIRVALEDGVYVNAPTEACETSSMVSHVHGPVEGRPLIGQTRKST